MRQIILDTETTGLDPSQGHRMVEVACVEMLNRGLTGRHLHMYLNPDRDSDPEALAIHGLTTKFLSEHPRFEDVADEFIDYVKGAEVIIHNAAFDKKFLNAELKRAGKPSFTACAARLPTRCFSRANCIPASAIRWTRYASATASRTRTAHCTAPCSTRSYWPRCGLP